MKRIAINGFGRIGRASLKLILESPEFELVAVNDLLHIENAAYLLQYDSVYRKYHREVSIVDENIWVDDKKILYFSKKNPGELPWKELKIDVVIESTGFFTNREDAEQHIKAGAK